MSRFESILNMYTIPFFCCSSERLFPSSDEIISPKYSSILFPFGRSCVANTPLLCIPDCFTSTNPILVFFSGCFLNVVVLIALKRGKNEAS